MLWDFWVWLWGGAADVASAVFVVFGTMGAIVAIMAFFASTWWTTFLAVAAQKNRVKVAVAKKEADEAVAWIESGKRPPSDDGEVSRHVH